MYEVLYWNNGRQYTTEFNSEKEATEFAMKHSGILMQDKEVLDNFEE